jgi:hypothetical protein
MADPLPGEFSAAQAVTKPDSNAAAKSIFIRSHIMRLYRRSRRCKGKRTRAAAKTRLPAGSGSSSSADTRKTVVDYHPHGG